MEAELSSFLDDGSLPLNPVDGLPEPRQLQVDQVIQGEIFRSASDLGGRQILCLANFCWTTFWNWILVGISELVSGLNGYRVTLTFWPSNHLFAFNN